MDMLLYHGRKLAINRVAESLKQAQCATVSHGRGYNPECGKACSSWGIPSWQACFQPTECSLPVRIDCMNHGVIVTATALASGMQETHVTAGPDAKGAHQKRRSVPVVPRNANDKGLLKVSPARALPE